MAKGTKYCDFLTEQLKDPTLAAEYIMAAINENDQAYLATAISEVVKAHGAVKIAKATSLSRQALHKMLSPQGNPTLHSLNAVLDAIGLKMKIEPKRKKAA